MHKRFITLALLLLHAALPAQHSIADSLRALLKQPASDTLRLARLDALIGETGPNEEGQRLNEEMGKLAQKVRKDPNPAIAKSGNVHYASYLGNYGYMAEQRGDIHAALAAYQEALPVFEAAGDKEGEAAILNNIGYIYNGLGNIPRAAENYQRALALRESIHNQKGIATCYNNLATLYRDQGDRDKALEYYEKFRVLCETVHDSSGIALALANIGNIYLGREDTVQAVIYLEKSLDIAKKIQDDRSIGHALSSMGNVSFHNGHYQQAIDRYNESIIYNERSHSAVSLINTKIRLAEAHLNLGNTDMALSIGQDAYDMSQKIGYKDAIANAAHLLKEIYKKRGDAEMALGMYELEVRLRDSLVNESNRKMLLRQELEYEYNQKKAALAVEQEKAEHKAQRDTLIRNFALGGLGVVVIFLLLVIAQRNRISRERKRSDDLLLNILPASVADELKQKGHAGTQAFAEVTVLFTDFKGFTRISELLSPDELVSELDQCFRAFDAIAGRYGIEKIKTIGDSYMAAGGIPEQKAGSAVDTLQAALDMNDFIARRRATKLAEGKPYFEIRIGLHTGPVVAGIVGVKKFAYDIWGDTVNTASRMESSGAPGKVNISEATYERVKHRYRCTSRGKIPVKDKGEVEMYFAEGKL